MAKVWKVLCAAEIFEAPPEILESLRDVMISVALSGLLLSFVFVLFCFVCYFFLFYKYFIVNEFCIGFCFILCDIALVIVDSFSLISHKENDDSSIQSFYAEARKNSAFLSSIRLLWIFFPTQSIVHLACYINFLFLFLFLLFSKNSKH